MSATMHEFKAGTLHSGSKEGPLVTDPKQAVAIGLSELKRTGGHTARRRKRRKRSDQISEQAGREFVARMARHHAQKEG
jgi:hypothetical protein